MQYNVDSEAKAAIEAPMENTHPYQAGRDECREQLVALIYDRYIYNRTFHGKESQVAMELKRLILDIREDQAIEQEKANQIETAAE
jgi:hypothetical protein